MTDSYDYQKQYVYSWLVGLEVFLWYWWTFMKTSHIVSLTIKKQGDKDNHTDHKSLWYQSSDKVKSFYLSTIIFKSLSTQSLRLFDHCQSPEINPFLHIFQKSTIMQPAYHG